MKGMVSWMPVVLVCVACGGGLEGEGEEVLFGVGAEDGGPAPRGAGPGSAPGDTAWGDGFEEAAPDASPGAFGWPCGEPGDCTSGFCVPAASGDGGFCTVPCIEDCPPGTSCRLAPQTLPDPIYICLPAYPAPWCRPCREASDCEDPWADEALECHEVSPWEGSFCTRGCLEDIDCSQGFSCMDGRCLPPGGCSCLEGPDATGWSTDCEATGRVGVCPGTRTCGEAGMSPCSAFIPQEEVCNGVDDDCDGLVDPPGVPGCSTFWRDGDGDGRGAGDPACLCGAQAGWVQQAGDCDDADPTVSPAAMEHCDLEDDDCDGVVDEAPAVGCLPCWLDADGDGWGGTEPACFCVPAAPWVLVDGDCDDQRPEVHPSAMELCDGADQDCDGVEDAVCDGDGDGWCAGPVPPSGCAPEAINYGVCQALHLAKLLLYCPAGYGDCQDGDGSVHPGAPELCDGKDQDCDAVVDEGMDLDGDGWCGGSGGACCPLGGGDCEDLDPAVHPGAGDLPDSLLMDTNCDGLDGDLSDAVMVHGVLGQDFFPGTPELPKRTLTAAVQEAVVQGVSQVLVGEAAYPEGLELVEGIGVFGRYTAVGGWHRHGPGLHRAVLQSPGAVAVRGHGIGASTVLEGLEVRASDAQGPAGASIAVFASGSPGLALRDLLLVTGDGAGGSLGANGAAGAPGASGVKGKGGCNSEACLWGKSCSTGNPHGGGDPFQCSATDCRCGGTGQAHPVYTLPETPGLPWPWNQAAGGQHSCWYRHHGPGKGGQGGAHGVTGHQDGWNGQDGAKGEDGPAGAAAGFGLLGSWGWTPGAGGSGWPGARGLGGGGGGKGQKQKHPWPLCDTNGAEGGGGGEGGTAGTGGGGGGGGRSVFGLVLRNSPVQVQGCTILLGVAGDGGAGGFGGDGGVGGDGAFGGAGMDGSGDGGRGGHGGRGGDGGGGAGGRGGHAVGILCTCGALPVTGDLEVMGGTAGKGGAAGDSGGYPGPAGPAGVREDLRCVSG